jgi:class 3 adenylate cyclase
LELNEDDGLHYLVLEFVAGQTVGRLLAERGRLDETEAMAILADVCRALAGAHERGIVHRDIKPDNILLVGPAPTPRDVGQPEAGARPRVKLSDFGLARHVVESASLEVTRAGTVLGTPLYMAPEQFSGAHTVDARADVYAIGATLFHLLAGRPPFVADDAFALMGLHRDAPAPALARFSPAVSDGVCAIVQRALAKHPDQRYRDAACLLVDLERLLRGEPVPIATHPSLPTRDSRRVLEYEFCWELQAAPEQLWPHVANTERLNRAAGLPAVRFTTEPGADGRVRRFGYFRKAGLAAEWEEHPFEWVEARRHGVLRRYSRGPFRWLVSTVELTPRQGGGSTLTHRVQLEPRGLLGRSLAAVEIGVRGRRALDRIYRRIDAFLAGLAGPAGVADPFEAAAGLSSGRQRRLEHRLDRLVEVGVSPAVAERLGEFVRTAPAQEVARIRPLALARRLGLEPQEVVAACLHGAREGLLVLLWDVLCPSCRIAADIRDTLRAVGRHGHCPACNLDFELDFAHSVEMIFRVHPEVRAAELGTYCVGGPAHSPHVVAQVRIAPAERVELELQLPVGDYRLRGPQLPWWLDLRIRAAATARRWDLNLARRPEAEAAPALQPGLQMMSLLNDAVHEIVVRVERTAPRDDALTAAAAATLGVFRELFPGEILSPGQLASVANVTLLATRVEARQLYDALGDAGTFQLLHAHVRRLVERLEQAGGALIRTTGEGALASLPDPVAAVRVGMDLTASLAHAAAPQAAGLRVALHRGPAILVTVQDRLEYFGETVQAMSELLVAARAGELILSPSLADEPGVAAAVREAGFRGEVRDLTSGVGVGAAAYGLVIVPRAPPES